MTRHPGGRPRRRPRHRALLALLLALAAAPAPAVGQTDDDVRRLIEQLDDPQLAVRQQATTTLEGYVRGNQLTRAQLGILRTYPANPPLELLRRKEAILARWTTAFPSVEAVVRGAEVRKIGSASVVALDVRDPERFLRRLPPARQFIARKALEAGLPCLYLTLVGTDGRPEQVADAIRRRLRSTAPGPR